MKSLFGDSKQVSGDVTYTTKTMVPQYTPSNNQPLIAELFNVDKYSKLVRAIKLSNVREDEKLFLISAAGRHIQYNYAKIADYYANATPEMQELMEQSALVILDIDDAIANGYVKFTKEIQRILDESGELAGEK